MADANSQGKFFIVFSLNKYRFADGNVNTILNAKTKFRYGSDKNYVCVCILIFNNSNYKSWEGKKRQKKLILSFFNATIKFLRYLRRLSSRSVLMVNGLMTQVYNILHSLSAKK